VLIVDDNDASVTLLSLLVKNFGNDVRVARDGEEALDVARQFQPEVVFMDLGMPKLDGYGACRLIRQEPWGQQVMLVALTGWGQDAHRQRTKEAGFDYHLVKPADPNELRRLLSQTSPDFETALN
jgi:CheY-like chemotaxis protein